MMTRSLSRRPGHLDIRPALWTPVLAALVLGVLGLLGGLS